MQSQSVEEMQAVDSAQEKPASGLARSRWFSNQAACLALSTGDSNSPEGEAGEDSRKGSRRGDRAWAAATVEEHWQPAVAPLANLRA